MTKKDIYNLNILHHKLKESSHNKLYDKVSREIRNLIDKYAKMGIWEQRIKDFQQAYRC